MRTGGPASRGRHSEAQRSGPKPAPESLHPEHEKTRSAAKEAMAREDARKIRVIALEAEIAAAQRNLREAQDEPSSGIGAATKAEQEKHSAGKRHRSRPTAAAAETIDLRPVSPEEAKVAVFSDAANRVVFSRACSDIASPNADVRANAARALGGVHHELSLRVLVSQVAREPSPLVRRECIKSLAALNSMKGLPAIERALTDPAASVRLAAVQGVYRLAGKEGAPALSTRLSDVDEEVRRRAATCLGWLGSDEHVGALLPLLADESMSVRRAAAEAMGRLRSRQSVSSLIECLHDPDESILKVALDSLEKITGRRMSESIPADEESRERLIARWRAWWRDEETLQARRLNER